jgi:hypothetical protein
VLGRRTGVQVCRNMFSREREKVAGAPWMRGWHESVSCMACMSISEPAWMKCWEDLESVPLETLLLHNETTFSIGVRQIPMLCMMQHYTIQAKYCTIRSTTVMRKKSDHILDSKRIEENMKANVHRGVAGQVVGVTKHC